jgi:hypothetical protein
MHGKHIAQAGPSAQQMGPTAQLEGPTGTTEVGSSGIAVPRCHAGSLPREGKPEPQGFAVAEGTATSCPLAAMDSSAIFTT